ncbi:hypothetical protein [Haloferula rosea]|uniref:hypothetical protein n=1 Tax=Haloferula rosea TaxID=490093 RepID=UPI001F3477FB|nr:hypothetical protein [Haloferula rosea]
MNSWDLLGLDPDDWEGTVDLVTCIDFEYELGIAYELLGRTQVNRDLDEANKKLLKLAGHKLAAELYDILNKALEVGADLVTSPPVQYQLAIVGGFECGCCCQDSYGKEVKVKPVEWVEDMILKPYDFDPDLEVNEINDGWGEVNPLPTDEELYSGLSKYGARLILRECQRCRKLCGQ